MPKIKDTVKEKYAEALEKSKEKKVTTCCTEGSPVEHKRPEKGLFSGELIAPSFGCIYDLPGRFWKWIWVRLDTRSKTNRSRR